MRDLTCQEFVELITDFLDGALETEPEHRFIHHLSRCRGCETYLNQFLRAIDGLRDVDSRAVPKGMRDALLQAFRDHPAECQGAVADDGGVRGTP